MQSSVLFWRFAMDEKTRKTFISIFSLILGVIFTLDGVVKLFGVRMPVEIISTRDYPTWLSYGAIIVELVGGILLLIEDARFYGGLLAVIGTFVGILYGIGTRDYLTLVLPVLFFLGSWIIGWSIMPERLSRILCSMPFLKMTHTCKVAHHH